MSPDFGCNYNITEGKACGIIGGGGVQMALPFHQHLFPPAKKIIREFDMLRNGDHVAVGVSGGKDSLVALYTLVQLQRMLPVEFSITAVSIDMGWPQGDWSAIEELCQSYQIPFKLVRSQIAQVLFEIRQESNPCSLCAKMRHGLLNDTAKELGCNVVALGHHSDDAIETVFLNMFYAGRIACFKPVTHLDRVGLRMIRPLLYVTEKTTTRVARKLELPVQNNPCPANGATKRQRIKELLAEQSRGDKAMPKRLLAAVKTLWENPT